MSNRLAKTLSPYLRAHAENPVDWYPWGSEAFAEAQRRDVPLLISIGYSTCHWCHVMARESFSSPEIAGLINRDFVAVKVDREEHPEVDGAYMAAASAFTQNLGWPLTVFATPQGRTFYAGTYWPPEARAPLPAFRDVLGAVQEAWTLRREKAVESADAVAEALAQTAVVTPSDVPSTSGLAAAAGMIASREDAMFGGYGGAPKFPVATTLGFLQHPLVRREAPDAAASAARALAAMAASDLRDSVDGGFFRYATQRDWTVPHYERMLTDNAQLLNIAVRAGDDTTARGIARFLLGVLRQDGGAFGAAQDSESWIDGQRSEGGYYLAASREELEPPAVDGKVITGWNGLAIGALAQAGAALDERSWVDAAAEAASFVLSVNRSPEGRLVRASLDGVASTAVATLADVGLFADGLLAVAVATGDARWAVVARELLDEVLSKGADGDPVLAAQGVAAAPDQTDGDLPSGVAALASAALTAWRLGAGEKYRAGAEEQVRAYAASAVQHPFGHGSLLAAAAGLVEPPRQVVVVTHDRAGALARASHRVDADVIAIVTPAQAGAFSDAGFELFSGKDAVADLVYDCRAFVCRLPTGDASAVVRSRESLS
ncbi:thioredoxin domain-containing protein [Microbacterium sp. A84]|uniref:thioredoxin domain-containing protein n=1 Tax=Microbacterium sp. A84 TaxID=3450715 RepID=UPI003F444AF0